MRTEQSKSRTVLAAGVLALGGVASPAFAETVLYSATSATQIRLVSAQGLDGFPATTLPNVLYDDVAIHNPNMLSHVAVSEITVGVYRTSGPTMFFELSWAALDGNAPTSEDALIRPRNVIANLTLTGGIGFTVIPLTFTPPEPILIPLNNSFHGDSFGSFAIGLRPSIAGSGHGWAVSPPDLGFVNDQTTMWAEAPEVGGLAAFTTGFPTSPVPATTYVVIKGTLVPAPGALSMLAACGLLALRRGTRGRSG
ncbi:MAG: hypothetical protein KF768_03400 [Phycisphaeraceae bacterium]|nr:hypothetical protein [Phycisphaeraceae bacterium]